MTYVTIHHIPLKRTFLLFNFIAIIMLSFYVFLSSRATNWSASTSTVSNNNNLIFWPSLSLSSATPTPSRLFLSPPLSPRESILRVKQIDDHLLHLSQQQKLSFKSQKLDINSSSPPALRVGGFETKLVYPSAIADMLTMNIDKERCSETYGDDLLALVMIFNRVDDSRRRDTLRRTWAGQLKKYSSSPSHSKMNAKVLFAVGLTHNKTVQNQLEEEDRVHGDIIQWNYYESYLNCTIKTLGILRWTALKCPLVKFVLKVDDDSLVVVDKMIQFCNNTRADSIYGHLLSQSEVVRNHSAKWFISKQDYSSRYYPDFIAGPWYIPGVSALPLYEIAIKQSLPALPFEDAYLGILAHKLNIPRKSIPNHGLVYLADYMYCDITKMDLCWYKETNVFWQGLNDTQLEKSWKRIYDFHNQENKVCPTNNWHHYWSLFKYHWFIIVENAEVCINE